MGRLAWCSRSRRHQLLDCGDDTPSVCQRTDPPHKKNLRSSFFNRLDVCCDGSIPGCCDDVCIEHESNVEHCGVCGLVCQGDAQCIGGLCSCVQTTPCPETHYHDPEKCACVCYEMSCAAGQEQDPDTCQCGCTDSSCSGLFPQCCSSTGICCQASDVSCPADTGVGCCPSDLPTCCPGIGCRPAGQPCA